MPKKPAKKAQKIPKTTPKPMPKGTEYNPHRFCICKIILVIIIIALVWISAATWSKVIITIAAALIILCAHCPCKKEKVK